MTTKRKSVDSDDEFTDANFLDPLGIIEETESSPKKIRVTASNQPNNFTVKEKELIFDTIGNVDNRLTNMEQMLLEMKTQMDEFFTYETTQSVNHSNFAYEFPLKTHKDLEILEQKLTDPGFFSEMVKYMRKRKSADNNDINKILCSLINDDISFTYNFDGVQTKKSFKALKFSEVFVEAWVSDMFCLEEYIKEVKKYLHKCRNRLSKRNNAKKFSVFD